MSKGWFVGNFEPTVYKTNEFEVAHHFHKAGFVGEKHFHKIGYELTYIIKGTLIASNIELGSGDMFLYEPNEISDVSFIEDTDLIVVKWPSVSNDKYSFKTSSPI